MSRCAGSAGRVTGHKVPQFKARGSYAGLLRQSDSASTVSSSFGRYSHLIAETADEAIAIIDRFKPGCRAYQRYSQLARIRPLSEDSSVS